MTETPTINILLVAVDIYSPNRGVNALTLGTLLALSQRYQDSLNITIINSSGPSDYSDVVTIAGRDVHIKKYRPRLRELASSMVKAVAFRIYPRNIAQRLLKSNRLLSAIQEAHIVIDLSEGDSFTSLYGRQRFLRHGLHKLLPIAMGRAPVLFPQTIGPFPELWTNVVAKKILDRSKLVITRDPDSTKIVETLLADKSKLYEASDMAFLMEASEPPQSMPFLAEPFIGVNISGLLYYIDDHYSDGQITWRQSTYRKLSELLLGLANTEWKRRIVLIPHVVGGEQKKDDLSASLALQKSLPQHMQKDVVVLESPLTAPQLKYVISKAEFFVGARMHSCIAALSTCTPLIAISYSHKFEGILRQLGMENLSCKPGSRSQEEMLAQIENAYANRVQIKAQLEETIPTAKARAMSCVSYI